jgi:iron complex outermembrane receptor protein
MLRLNLAGFHYKIKNYQVRSASPALGAQAFLLNAAAVKVDGVEAEFEFVPVRELRIVGNATYLKSRFSSFPNNSSFIPNPAVCTPGANPPGRTTGPISGGNTLCIGSATGNRTPQSPRFAASLGVTYTMAVGSQGEIIANLQANHTGKVFFESDNRLFQRDYNRINASLEYRPSPNWGIEIYGKNLTDRHAYVSASSGGTGDQGQLGAPLTYGVNLKFDF